MPRECADRAITIGGLSELPSGGHEHPRPRRSGMRTGTRRKRNGWTVIGPASAGVAGAQTGVQLLTGFLLTLPFQQRFTQLDDVMRTIYLVTVGCSIGATVLLIAPVSMHRLLFRQHRLRPGVGRTQLRDGRNGAARRRPRRGGRRHLRHRGGQDGSLGRRRLHVAALVAFWYLIAAAQRQDTSTRVCAYRPGEHRAHVDPTNCAPDVVSGLH